MDIIVNNGQWLGDIALETAGSIEALFALSAANNISITADIDNGTKLETTGVLDSRVFNWFSDNAINPATALRGDEDIKGGIGDMIIEVDFIIN